MEKKLGERTLTYRGKFDARSEENGEKHICGYFAVFDSIYQMCDSLSEKIDAHAFDDCLKSDIRCLTDHDTRLVLGRTTAGTFTISVDSHGLYGDVLINEEDSDAMNTYARVKRGDVNQCSIGFDIIEENKTVSEEGVCFTITKVELYEGSVCTFPAYEETAVEARKQQAKNIEKRKLEVKKDELFKKLEVFKNA